MRSHSLFTIAIIQLSFLRAALFHRHIPKWDVDRAPNPCVNATMSLQPRQRIILWDHAQEGGLLRHLARVYLPGLTMNKFLQRHPEASKWCSGPIGQIT